MESLSSTPSILPPSPPPLRPEVSHNLKENGNDKNNGVGYLLSTKNLLPQRKTSHLHFTKGINTYKNNLQSSKKLFAITPSVEEAGTLSKRVRHRKNGEEQQETKNKWEENGAKVTSKIYSQNTCHDNTEQSNFTVEHDAESENDDSIIALSNRRQESTDCDSIDYSLRSEESPVTALLSPTASTTTLPYNSSLDTPRVEDTYKVNDSFDSWNNHNEKERKHSVNCIIYEHVNNKSKLNEELEENELLSSDIDQEVREHSLRDNNNEICEESMQKTKYEIQELNTLRKEEKYEGQEKVDTNDELMQYVRSPGDNNTKHKLPLSTLPSSSALSSSSALLSEHEEEEEEEYRKQIEEEHEEEEYLEKSQSTLSTITVSSSSTEQEDNEHQSVTHEEQNEIKKLSEVNSDKESNEEDEINDSSSSSSSSLYRRNDDLFILEEEEQEKEEEEEEEEKLELKEEAQDRIESNGEMEEKVITRKLSSSDADTRNFILPPPMPLSPCETNHLLSPDVSDEVKDNNNDDTCLQTNEEHEQQYVVKGDEEYKEELEMEEMELLNNDKREESDKEVHTSNTISNEFDNNEHDSIMPDVKMVNGKCEINNNDHSIVVVTTTSDTSRISNSKDAIDNEVNVVADGDMGVDNSHKVVQVKKIVTRELELPFADEEQQSDHEHTPHDKVIKWPENNNTHDEPKTSNVQESTTFVHKSHLSTLTSELSSIILLSSSSTPPPLALLPRTEQVKTQTHLLLSQEIHNKDKQATRHAQKATLPNKDRNHYHHEQQKQQEQQTSKEQREEINKLIHKAFVELGGKLAKTDVISRKKVNESTNNKYDKKNHTKSMNKNQINKVDIGSKDANRHTGKITNSLSENVHGVQLGRLCRALGEFGISFDVKKFRQKNNLLFANKENRSNQQYKERTEQSFHSLQLLPFRSQSSEYEEEEEDHGILTYNIFTHIIKTELLQGKNYKSGDDSMIKVPTHTLHQNKSQLQLDKYNDLTNKNKTNCQYMTLASERSSDLLMSSILSLHEATNNPNYGNNNKNTLEKVINSEQTPEKPNDALAELQCQESSTHPNRSSPDVRMEHNDATRTKSNDRDKVMRSTASIECKEETSTVTATPQQTCIDHAEESLDELHYAHIAENSSMIDSDLDSCRYTPHFSRFTFASSVTSSARAPSISSYYEDSVVNVEFPEVTPNSAIAELCRRIRYRLYNNKRMALQDRKQERRSAKKEESIKLDEHSDLANSLNAIKSVEVSSNQTHRMNLAKDKFEMEKDELHKKPTFAYINVRKSEKDAKGASNGKLDNTKTNTLMTAATNISTTTTTRINNKAGNSATVTIDANQKAHTIKRHSKQTKHNKNKTLHSPSQSSTTSTSVLPADNAKVSWSGASHSMPEQRTSASASSISSSPVPKRPSLVAALHRPVIISSKVKEELVRLSPYYTKRFVQFRHASHLRSCDSNISNSSNNRSSTNQNKSSEKVIFAVDSTSSANTNSLEAATSAQSENALLEEMMVNEPEIFHRHSEPAQERIVTPALSSASAPSSAASLPLPSKHFTSPFRSRTPEWSSHLGTEPVRWSSNVSELFEQWKRERAFPSLSRPIRHASATPFTNFPTTHHGKQNAHRPKRKTKKCNGIDNINCDDVVKQQSDNAKNSQHEQKEEQKHTYGTFRRHYEQKWINSHNVCSVDNTKSSKEVCKYHNSVKENSVVSSWQVNDPSCLNEGSYLTSPSLNLPCASPDKLHEGVCDVPTRKDDTHNISSKYVPGTYQKNNLFSEDREESRSLHSPPRQRTTANLAIQWGRMKSCNRSSKVNTLLNTIYNSYRYNDLYDKNDKRNTRRVFAYDYNDDKNNNDAITSNVIDSNKTDVEEINRVHSSLNALYTTKAELETLLHERIYSSSRTNNAVQITREQRVINQIKQKLNQVLDDISRYMQRVAPNTNIICDSNY